MLRWSARSTRPSTRGGEPTLIIARTDAAAIEGFEAAIERRRAYADAGADVLFVEAPRTREQLRAVATALSNRAPLLANMVEGGKTPILSGTELEALGFRLVIFPGGIVRALVRTAVDFYECWHATARRMPSGTVCSISKR